MVGREARSIMNRSTGGSNNDNISQEDIVFSILKESELEEYLLGINTWFASLPENNITADFSKAPRMSKEEMENQIQKGTVFISMRLKSTKELIGCCSISKPEILDRSLTCFFSNNSIKTEYRKRGLGSLFFDECERTAKKMGAKRIILNVYDDLKFQIESVLGKGCKLIKTTTKHKSEFQGSKSRYLRESLTFHSFEKYI